MCVQRQWKLNLYQRSHSFFSTLVIGLAIQQHYLKRMASNIEKEFSDHKEETIMTDGHHTEVERKNSVVLSPGFTPEVTTQGSWLERTLKPTSYTPRYPFVGKPLLWMTCAFGSLGDALFGYDQGIFTFSTKLQLEPC
jgi:hypothetical protein